PSTLEVIKGATKSGGDMHSHTGRQSRRAMHTRGDKYFGVLRDWFLSHHCWLSHARGKRVPKFLIARLRARIHRPDDLGLDRISSENADLAKAPAFGLSSHGQDHIDGCC